MVEELRAHLTTLKRDRTVSWTPISLCLSEAEKFLEACLVYHLGIDLPGSLPQINLSPEAWHIVISRGYYICFCSPPA